MISNPGFDYDQLNVDQVCFQIPAGRGFSRFLLRLSICIFCCFERTRVTRRVAEPADCPYYFHLIKLIVSVINVVSFITIEAFRINGKLDQCLCTVNPTLISANHVIGLRFSENLIIGVFLVNLILFICTYMAAVTALVLQICRINL